MFFLTWRLSVCFKNTPIAKINKGLLVQNKAIRKVKDSTGEERDAHIKVTSRVQDDREANLKDDDNIGFLLEVEEALWEPLIKECKGVLRLGSGDGILEGEGLRAQVRRFHEEGLPIEPRVQVENMEM